MNRVRISILVSLVGLAAVLQPARAADKLQFDISPQPLSQALFVFSKQTNIAVLSLGEDLKDLASPGVRGEYAPVEALKILLGDNGMTYEFKDPNTLLIRAAESRKRALTAEKLRVARVEEEGEEGKASEAKKEEAGEKIDEVVVTGSRLTRKAAEGAQAVRVYDREAIERSGQTTVSGFLSALPSVSIKLQESAFQTSNAGTTVRLRGLPIGTTLVLINGQRVETSGSQSGSNIFDLNNIPIDAVARVEVLSSGTSIYGSDAIAGVVNIILRKDFDGMRASARYGSAQGTDELNASVAWGYRRQRGGLSIIGSFRDRSELRGAERELTASNDYRRFGGPDRNRPTCHPGNVFFPNGFSFNGGPPVQSAAVPASLTGTPSVEDFAATAGALNTCGSPSPDTSIIPDTKQASLLISGEYELAPSLSIFSDLLYSRTQQHILTGLQTLRTQQVSATNPYNPFATPVTVSYAFPGIARTSDGDMDFGRALLGARGNLGGAWTWEASVLHSQDWMDNPSRNAIQNRNAIQAALNSADPATALNPFTAGPPGSPELLRTLFGDSVIEFEGRRQAVGGFVRGPILELPAGAVELVVGSEYAREKQHANFLSDPLTAPTTNTRRTTALFGEARVPILSGRERASDILALTFAARYDDYDDFGSTTNPQFAAEWRPFDTLLVRGTYAEAFKAPSLRDLNDPEETFPDSAVTDPATGQRVFVTDRSGGNSALRPEVGQSETLGAVYSSQAVPGFKLSITHWKVIQTDAITRLGIQAIVDHEASFSDRVIRDQSGAIQLIDTRLVNFGGIDAAGLDFDLNHERATYLGTWSGSVSATQIYRYDVQLVPGASSLDHVNKADTTNNWAPRWKGTATIGWQRGPYSVSFDGRYVSHYQDYGSTREIGDFWLYDAHLRCDLGAALTSGSSLLKRTHLDLGAVNLFDTLPQYSNYSSSFLGYDPAQADIRGRYLYLQVGVQL